MMRYDNTPWTVRHEAAHRAGTFASRHVTVGSRLDLRGSEVGNGIRYAAGFAMLNCDYRELVGRE